MSNQGPDSIHGIEYRIYPHWWKEMDVVLDELFLTVAFSDTYFMTRLPGNY